MKLYVRVYIYTDITNMFVVLNLSLLLRNTFFSQIFCHLSILSSFH